MTPGDPVLTDLARTLGQQQSKAGLRLGSGTILAWDPDTLSGTVRYQDTVLTDLPILSALDAFSWQPGDEVTLLGWHPVDGHRRAGFGSYFILGRVFRPGATNSARVLQALQNEFARQISGEIFSDRVNADTIADSDLIDTDTYDDIATVGPTVADVPVTIGTLIIWPSLSLGVAVGAGVSFSSEAYMSYEITGPTNVSPSDERAARLTLITTDEDAQVVTRPAGAFVHTGLGAGSYTVQAKYRTGAGDENSASANDRTIVALGI